MITCKYCPICRSLLIEMKIDGRKRSGCSSCGWINYVNPVPVVACLVKDDRNGILLIKRGVEPCKGHWALPGGFIEIDETSEAAGQRELKEETGLSGEPGRLIGVYSQDSETYGKVLIVGIEFIKGPNSGNISVGEDAEDAEFFSTDSMPEVPFISHSKLIRDYLAHGK
ncbi:MAG: NUDIX hydrolase [Candidatus Omnitrophica bacterium]|nr:NUDIX hydrolase [Candidatus Omnitrophota bacterium]